MPKEKRLNRILRPKIKRLCRRLRVRLKGKNDKVISVILVARILTARAVVTCPGNYMGCLPL